MEVSNDIVFVVGNRRKFRRESSVRVVLSVMPERFLTISPYAYKVCIFVLSFIVILRKCAQNKHHISGVSYNLVLSTLQVEATKKKKELTKRTDSP